MSATAATVGVRFFALAGELEKAFEEDSTDIDPGHSTTFVYNPHVALSYEQQRQRLPIFNCRNHILYLLEKHQTVVLVGETGCGKSTQVPQVSLFYLKVFRKNF